MDGPTFLFVYALISLALIAISRWFLWIGDRSGRRAPPPVPATFDPYEIAYLRDAKNAVIRTVMYALYHRGLVEIIPGKWFKASKIVASHDGRGVPLTGLEDRVLRSVSAPTDPSTLFQGTLGRDVEQFCAPFRNRLQSEELFRSDADRHAALMIPWAATAIIVITGLGRFMGSSPGARVGLLFFVMTIAILLLWWRNRALDDISERGRAWLKQIQTAYQDANMPPVAQVGLFGIQALNGTSDAPFATLFSKGSGSGGCGGGCGSGCGGGCGGD
jgi:uncharacterized protein (TIGR04222 family)